MLRFPPQPMWDLTIHPPPPLGPSVLAHIRSPLQSMWDSPIHPLQVPAFSLAHRLVSTPVGVQSPWHIARCLALIPFVTAQTHRLQILTYLGFPLQASPQGFKMLSSRERFSHLYKECFIPLSNQCGISQ